ncbi:MAG: DUF2927 domain-containing protein [Desulfovibrionaceae bacterium]|nr:DUF2927 domain-containing protein [Desulfovibrionaceae bacterium]
MRPYVEAVPSQAVRATAEQPASVSAQTEATVTMLAPRGDASRTGEAGLSDPQVEHFLRVAMYDRDEQEFHRGRGLPGEPAPRVLTRWEGDVIVRVAGDAAPEALALVRAAVRRVDGALPINGGVRARMAEQGGNVAVYVFPRAPSRDVEAYSTLRHDGARITGAEIVLYQDLLTEKVVVREFLRVLGLPGEDAKLPGTVLAPVATGASGKRAAIGPLPDLDADALRILYGPTLRAGMNIEEVRTALR